MQVKKAFNLDHGALTEHAEKVAPGSEGVNFLPYLTGEAPPAVLMASEGGTCQAAPA